MGWKTRLVTIEEKYFKMECDDLAEAVKSHLYGRQLQPKIIILHPGDYESIKNEFRDKVGHYHNLGNMEDQGESLQFMGIKTIESPQIKQSEIEIY